MDAANNSYNQQKENVINMGKEILSAIDKIQFILLHELIKMDNYNRIIDSYLDNGNHELLQSITESKDYRKTFGVLGRENEAIGLIDDSRNAMNTLATFI